MLIVSVLSFVLFGLCGVFHYSIMRSAHVRLMQSALPRSVKLLVCLYTAGIAHIAEAGLYAIAFKVGQRLGVGGFSSENTMTPMDTVYFSLVNFTSLGLGDIYPTGHLRLLAGVETLNGFLLITCSASFIYLLMAAEMEKK